jgi:hypothetical protein
VSPILFADDACHSPTEGELQEYDQVRALCPLCGGEGEIWFNLSPSGDPQCADSARCPECNGDGGTE